MPMPATENAPVNVKRNGEVVAAWRPNSRAIEAFRRRFQDFTGDVDVELFEDNKIATTIMRFSASSTEREIQEWIECHKQVHSNYGVGSPWHPFPAKGTINLGAQMDNTPSMGPDEVRPISDYGIDFKIDQIKYQKFVLRKALGIEYTKEIESTIDCAFESVRLQLDWKKPFTHPPLNDQKCIAIFQDGQVGFMPGSLINDTSKIFNKEEMILYWIEAPQDAHLDGYEFSDRSNDYNALEITCAVVIALILVGIGIVTGHFFF